MSEKTQDVLMNVSTQVSRLQDRIETAVTPAILAAALDEDFDDAVDIVKEKLGGNIPLAIETVRLVVHEAKEAGVPLIDEYGLPHRLGTLKAHIQRAKNEAKAKTAKPSKKRRSKRS